MKIILYKDVPNLGEEGDIKIVADGYARNYLFPNKFAVPHSHATEIELAQKMNSISRRRQEKIDMAATLKEKIESLQAEIGASVGEKGKLFGSITSAMIMEYLDSIGIDMERRKIELPENGIKNVGDYVIKVKMYNGETASLKLKVVPKEQKDSQVQKNKKRESTEDAEVNYSETSEAKEGNDISSQASEIEEGER